MEQQQRSEIKKNDYVCRRLNAIMNLVIQKNPTEGDENNICNTVTELSGNYPELDFAPFYIRLRDIYNQRGLEPRIERLKLLFRISERINND